MIYSLVHDLDHEGQLGVREQVGVTAGPRRASFAFEPEKLTSGYRWDLGLGFYEEVRDSGEDFFFEWLPAGEYTLRHRLRAAMAGTFRVAPATLQSMYAPEFAAYSSGAALEVMGKP